MLEPVECLDARLAIGTGYARLHFLSWKFCAVGESVQRGGAGLFSIPFSLSEHARANDFLHLAK